MRETTCGYLIRGHQWLMMLRNKKPNDINEGKWIGIGGKKEPGETIQTCMHREIMEETGLDASHLELRGELTFHYQNAEAEKIYVYTTKSFTGILKECQEGTLQWINDNEILSLELWEGDRIFLKRLLADDHTKFSYILSYDTNGNLLQVIDKEMEL